MKKALLSIALVACAAISSYANSLNIVNTRNCAFLISTQGGYINVTPSGTPGAMQYFPTGNFSAAKVLRDALPAYQINVGPGTVTVNSATVGDAPACNSGSTYNVMWQVDGSGNITLFIY